MKNIFLEITWEISVSHWKTITPKHFDTFKKFKKQKKCSMNKKA